MSWLDILSNLTKNVGRGALDVFTLGGNELGHHFGGQGYQNIMKIPETAMGANLEAGATGGSAISGAGALGGSSAMTPYMPASAPNMGMAGSTLGGGMTSPMNLAPAYGSATGASAGIPAASAAGPSSYSQILQMMRAMPQGGGQQQAPQQSMSDKLQMLYKMFPGLRPGAPMGQGMNAGGGYGA
jgi:hypothetical protein